MLAAHKAEQTGYWVATNSSGKKGLVSSAHVIVKTQGLGKTLGRGKNKKNIAYTKSGFMGQGAARDDLSTLSGFDEVSGKNKAVVDDWSDSESDFSEVDVQKSKSDEGQQVRKATVDKPTKPVKPSLKLPPGLPTNLRFNTMVNHQPEQKRSSHIAKSKPAATPVSKRSTHVTQPKPTSAPNAMRASNVASVKPAFTPLNNTNRGNSSKLGDLQNPGSKPMIPTFGSSGNVTGGAPVAPTPTLRPSPVEETKNKKKKKAKKKKKQEKKSVSTRKPSARPAGGPMGGGAPAFLAEINKGKQKQGLKKVQTKESQGPSGTVLDANGKRTGPPPRAAPSKPAGGFAPAGGMLGELQSKLNKRRV
eukprot:augustus_masked-scaffold_65-processed-gene-0.54-mRNA-1 protein AED:1.00 eAED:1.00 QI:0/-1/0/0/-1/1/1/0/360